MSAQRASECPEFPVLAVFALFTTGLGWGTTGLFVRWLSEKGLSVYELLFLRLGIAGALLIPIFLFTLRPLRKTQALSLLLLGLSTMGYYLGAITAFRFLPVVLAALIIGLSPALAWILDYRRLKSATSTHLGVGLATVGLLLLTVNHFLNEATGFASETSGRTSLGTTLLGIFSAISAAAITVFNARWLKKEGPLAPSPLQINVATILIGTLLSSFFVLDFSEVYRVANENPGLSIGFGVLSTVLPGLSIAYAATRLASQATATVSVQLQVWTGVFGWLFLSEKLSVIQIVAAILTVAGSWICATAKPVARPGIDL